MDKQIPKKKRTAAAEGIYQENGRMDIKGRFENTPDGKTPVSLIIRKRDAELEYESALSWSGDHWTASLEKESCHLARGIWDFYLRDENEKDLRVKLDETAAIPDEGSFLVWTEAGSNELNMYRTVKGSLSMRVKLANIAIEDFNGELEDKEAGTVRLSGKLGAASDSLSDARLVIVGRGAGERWDYPLELDQHRFTLDFPYGDIIPADAPHNKRWDVYLETDSQGERQLYRCKLEQAAASLEENSRFNYESGALYRAAFYETVNGNLSVLFQKLQIVRSLDSCTLDNQSIHIMGHAYLSDISFKESSALNRQLFIQNRDTRERLYFPLPGVPVKDEAVDSEAYDMSGFDLSISLSDIYALSEGDLGRFDFFVRMEHNGQTYDRKIGFQEYTYAKDDYIARTEFRAGGKRIKTYIALSPGGNIAMSMLSLSMQATTYLQFGLQRDLQQAQGKEIWLIGERPDTAQDTGYHFFKYMRTFHPEVDAYYVIDRTSRDFEKVSQLGNVIEAGTLEHIKVAATADTFIGSHDLEYLLPLKGEDLDNYVNGRRVFLQHGVLGRKNVEYHKPYYKYPFQLVCVSSEPEKQVVAKKLGYEPDEIQVTGLSRFDALLESRPTSNTILLMPTWREWLTTEDAFLGSGYYNRYRELLQNEQLHDLLEKHDLTLEFYPHYRMQLYADYFSDLETDRVKVIKKDERTVQELLQDSKLLITDYSSVSFDFNYMSKPVIFYHFDVNAFFQKGIVRPVEETFLGDICNSAGQIVDALSHYVAHDFHERPEITKKKTLIFSHIDKQNCERIYQAIRNLEV